MGQAQALLAPDCAARTWFHASSFATAHSWQWEKNIDTSCFIHLRLFHSFNLVVWSCRCIELEGGRKRCRSHAGRWQVCPRFLEYHHHQQQQREGGGGGGGRRRWRAPAPTSHWQRKSSDRECAVHVDGTVSISWGTHGAGRRASNSAGGQQRG